MARSDAASADVGEGDAEFVAVLKALLRSFRKECQDEIAQFPRALGIDVIGMFGRVAQVALVKLADVVRGEGHAVGEHHIHGDAERV